MWWRQAKEVFSTQEQIEELPGLDLVDDPSLVDLMTRRRWNLRDFKRRTGWGDPSYEMSIVPHLRHEIEEPDEHSPFFYDPRLSDIEREGPWRPTSRLREESGLSPDLPWEKDEGSLYRGMSDEELLQALRDSFIESKGEHNIGEAQRGLSYFSTEPRQAVSYAGTFAPYNWLPSFDHPGFVARIPRPERTEVHPRFPTEVGVRGKVPMGNADILRLQPYGIRAGRLDLIPRWDRDRGKVRYEAGTRSSPSIYHGFREQDPGEFLSEFDR